jgi:catechol-2,3-dioxygenase
LIPRHAFPVAGKMRTNGLCELTLETPDPQRLARFYADVFALPLLSEEGDRVWLGCGEQARLGLWSPGEKEFGDRGGRHVHFALSAAPGRLDVVAERLGADVQEHDGGDRSLYVEDPEGNVVEVWDFFGRGRPVEALEAD